MRNYTFVDVAVVEFEDGFTIALHADQWWKELATEAVRLNRWGDVRVHLFEPVPFRLAEFRKVEVLHARV